MVQWIEKEIGKMLSKGKTSSFIADNLLKKVKLQKKNQFFLDVCQFLYIAGLHDQLVQLALTQFKKKEVVPWPYLIEILSSNEIEISEEEQKYFIEGILKQDQVINMLASKAWDETCPELVEMKMKKIREIHEQKDPNFVKLTEDLEFIQAQGIMEKEKQILLELKELDSKNPKIEEKILQFREKWSRYIISTKKQHLLNKAINSIPSDTQWEKQAEAMMKSIKKILKKNPDIRYDMALLFLFIGHPKLALQILEKHLNNISSQWLYLDLLLQSSLYLDCLNFVDVMEAQYNSDPETVFALTYIRAKAYYGLDKKTKARKILSELLAVRPNYRLTRHLLERWNND